MTQVTRSPSFESLGGDLDHGPAALVTYTAWAQGTNAQRSASQRGVRRGKLAQHGQSARRSVPSKCLSVEHDEHWAFKDANVVWGMFGDNSKYLKQDEPPSNTNTMHQEVLLMEEVLHQLIDGSSHHL